MWLILQIAAGIVLAYIIIRNGAAVWRYSLGMVALLAIVAMIFIVGVFTNEAVASYGGLGVVLTKGLKFLGYIVAAVVYILCLLAEGYGVKVLFNRLFHRRWQPEQGLFFAGAANFMLTGLVLQGFDLTQDGPILGPIDAYGRQHGFADGLTVAAWLFASLWIVPLGWWLDRRKPTIAEEQQND